MKIWVDAQISPAIAVWITENYLVESSAVRDLGLRDAEDRDIFLRAKQEEAIMLTKDSDFVFLLDRFGPPPKIIWLTSGNTSNKRLREILTRSLSDALRLFEQGDNLVEIRT